MVHFSSNATVHFGNIYVVSKRWQDTNTSTSGLDEERKLLQQIKSDPAFDLQYEDENYPTYVEVRSWKVVRGLLRIFGYPDAGTIWFTNTSSDDLTRFKQRVRNLLRNKDPHQNSEPARRRAALERVLMATITKKDNSHITYVDTQA